MEILEIVLAMLAVFGGYTLLSMLKAALLYPKRVRKCLRCAVFTGEGELREAAAYCRYLRLCGKISSERLIILSKDDIMVEDAVIGDLGDVYHII